MAKWNRFLSENLSISVAGHLVILGVVFFLAGVILDDTSRIIAPDRIQITMIDLNQVHVTGNETKLHNTTVEPDKPEQKSDAKTVQPQKPTEDAKEKIDTPSILPDEQKPDAPDKTNEKKPDNAPAPKKKTVVRVNRNVVALDRTLTVSVVDALRVAMTRCWTIDTKRNDISNIRAVAHLTMRKNGTVSNVWFESAARAETDAAFAYVLDTIRDAINVCQPLRMLPVGEYDKWQKIQLTFYPTTGAVM